MKEVAERRIEVGFRKKPQAVIDEVEKVIQDMAAQGWKVVDTANDEVLENIFLFFEREILDQTKG